MSVEEGSILKLCLQEWRNDNTIINVFVVYTVLHCLYKNVVCNIKQMLIQWQIFHNRNIKS